MNKLTLKALKESIKKWEKNHKMAKQKKYLEIRLGSDSCSLCKTFPDCISCPIVKKAKDTQCLGTPYYMIHDMLDEHWAIDEKRHKELLKLIDKEIRFLKSLLPKKEKDKRKYK